MNRSVPGPEATDPSVRRALLIVVVWVVATAIGLTVAALTTVGPVVIRLAFNHGVHLGDLIAFAVLYGAALLATTRIVASSAT